jgi:gliding motility-associated-like protein
MGTGLSAGIYTVTVTDNNGCIATAATSITQPPRLTVSAPIPPPVCSGNDTIRVFASNGQAPYTYSWNNGITSKGPGPLIVNSALSPYICTITDACGNVVKDTINIATAPGPVVTACCTTTIKAGDDTVLVAKGNGIVKYKWEDSVGVTCLNPSCDSVKVAPATTTTYTVIGTDAQGCADETILTITVETPCFNFIVPNVFTPANGGTLGLDKIFYIQTTGLSGWSIIIYDRWGKVMFQTTNQYEYWDGNTKGGGQAPSGVYYYIITGTCQGNNYKKDGFLQLIR